GDGEDDGDRRGCRFGGQRWSGASACNDHGDRSTNQFGRQRRQSIELILGPAIFDHYILALDEAYLLQALAKCAQAVRGSRGRRGVKEANHRQCRLLRARLKWPRHRTAEQRDELAARHSITSSARASSAGGNFEAERPRGLEVEHRLSARSRPCNPQQLSL